MKTIKESMRAGATALNEECMDVKRGEAVVVYKSGGAGKHYRDNHTHCTTVCDRTARPSHWRFVGVASTQCQYSEKLNHDRGFVVQGAGVVVVMNESNFSIKPGDIIGIRQPPPNFQTRERGIPRDKPRFFFLPIAPRFIRPSTKAVGVALSEAAPGEKFDLNLKQIHT
ncbi:hypothetical protein OAU26_03750 [Mariniblastus sp.]|nr:hypothetical protein [Mariniblastus sp.]